MNSVLRLSQTSFSKFLVACNFLLDFNGLLKMLLFQTDTELIHLLIHLCFKFLIITLNLVLCNSLNLNLLFGSFFALLLCESLYFLFFNLFILIFLILFLLILLITLFLLTTLLLIFVLDDLLAQILLLLLHLLLNNTVLQLLFNDLLTWTFYQTCDWSILIRVFEH